MILDPEAFADFRRLHSQFMFFVARYCPEIPDSITSAEEFMELSPADRFTAHEMFRENASELLIAYLKENPDALKKPDLEVIESWKLAEHGDFFVFRQLKKHMIFLDGKSEPKAFGVVGLTQPILELILQLPAAVETTLLPFRGKIVCDGMIAARQISFGPGIKASLNDSYRLAKETSGIITTLGATPQPKKTARKKPKKKITAAQRLSRLVNSIHKKMKDVREKAQTLKEFEEETEPAFRAWFEENYGGDKERIDQLEQEIEDLEYILDEANHAYRYGSFQTGAEAVKAAEQDLEEEGGRDLDDSDHFRGSESPFPNDDVSEEIPDFIIDELFAAFMKGARGIDIDDLSSEEYQKARQQFTDTMDHAQNGDKSAFEKALLRTGADESEDNVSAVKKVFRRLARKIHPDRNPDFGDEAQEIWDELKAAREALDLDSMKLLETRWRVFQKETFSEEEEPVLKDLQSDLTHEMRELNRAVKQYKIHPMWGVDGDEPPEEFKRQVSAGIANDTRELEQEKQHLMAEIERLKKLKKNKPSAKKKTPKTKTAAKRSTRKKTSTNIKPSHEQMTFDF